MKTSEILDATASHIDRVGLHKGDGYKDWSDQRNSPCCIIGALGQVADGACEPFNPPMNILRSIIPGGRVAAWNDDPERTQAEVVAKLREAAELARAEGK